MLLKDLLNEKRKDILRIAAKHGVVRVRVFGSVARAEDGKDSDVDLVVEVGPRPSPWFPGSPALELEELLGRKVNIATEDSIYWVLRRRILKEAVPL